jgi:hypothetical protein
MLTWRAPSDYKGMRWLRCRAHAGPIALVGADVGSVLHGIGNLASSALGAVVGCVAGLAGAP